MGNLVLVMGSCWAEPTEDLKKEANQQEA